MSDSERKERRYAASQALLVRCDNWGDFVQLYAADVSQGGMFIVTSDPPPLMSYVDVKMGLPEGHEVALRGRIVHVITAEQAKLEGRPPGVGVEFHEIEPELKAQIHHLIEFARWEGSNPNASFSRHLSEVSLSQSPGKLMESLRPPGARASAPPTSSGPPSHVAGSAESVTAQTHTRRKSEEPRSDTSFSTSALAIPTGDLDFDSRQPSSAPAPAIDTPVPDRASSPDGAAPGASELVGMQPGAPRGTDPVALKVGMTHISYKRYAQAVKAFEDLLKRNPGDREVKKWLHLAQARQYLSKKNEVGAAQAYQQMLDIDESNREARKFVREHHMSKRLQSLPFARYFAKKKP